MGLGMIGMPFLGEARAMIRGVLLAWVLLLVTLVTSSPAQDGTPATALPPEAESKPVRPSFRVVFWYARKDPLKTVRWQIYDLRKGEYTHAIDDWLTLLKTGFPSYEAFVRDVESTELEDVRDMIFREVVFLSSGLPRPVLGPFKKPSGPPSATSLDVDRYLLNSRLSGRASSMTPLRPRQLPSSSPSPGFGGHIGSDSLLHAFPVPYPYPRPHP
jgi:hypothetical protein